MTILDTSFWNRDPTGCLAINNASGKYLLDSVEALPVKFAIWIVICTSVTGTGNSEFSILAVSPDDYPNHIQVNHNRFSHLTYGSPIRGLTYEADIANGQLRLFGTAIEMVNYKVYRFWSNLSYYDNLLTNNETTYTGDVEGFGSTDVELTLKNTGVTAGTYNTVTVDAKGRVLSGTNTTSLAAIFQVVTGAINAYSGTSKLPIANSPTITSGTQIWTQPITIIKGTRVLLKCQLFADSSNNNNDVVAAFFRGNLLVGVVPIAVFSSGIPSAISYMDYDEGVVAGTTYTYSCRVGGTASGTWYINQDKCGDKWGSNYKNSYSLTEIA